MLKSIKFAFSATILIAMLSSATQATEYSQQDIEEIVRNYLLTNPEVIVEAINVLQAREEARQAEEAQSALSRLQPQLVNNPLDPVGGNADGSVTIIEFADYNCGFCKRANATLQALIEANPDLRVVYKEWPILSESSEYASRVALATNLIAPSRYEELHNALMNANSLRSEADVWRIVANLRLDRQAIEAQMNAPEVEQHLAETQALARSLGITGTPAFVVGNEVLRGAFPQADIQKAIDLAKQ